MLDTTSRPRVFSVGTVKDGLFATILGLENNNCFSTLKSLPAAARLPVIFQSKLLSTRQREAGPIKKSESWDLKAKQRGSSDGSEPPIAHTDLSKQEADKGWTSLNPSTQNLHPPIKM